MKKILIGICAVLIFVTSCGKVPKLSNGQDAIVTSKDGDIAVDDLYKNMKDIYALTTLIDMIDMSLLEKDYPSNDEEKDYIKSQLEQLEYSYKNSYYSSYYANFNAFAVAYFGVSDMDAVNRLLSLQYKRELFAEDYSRESVTDKEIEEYYKNDFIGDIKASHILIKADYDENTATEEEKNAALEEALNKAKEVITKLNNGEKFEDLAKEYSSDGTKDNGGDLGWFNRGDMIDEFMDAVIPLEKGKYTTTPVKSRYGYHIILKVDQKEKASLEDAREDIIDTLAEEKRNDDSNYQSKALLELRKSKEIAIQDDTLKKQYENYIANIG